jgi:hypothetical protein
VSCEHSNSMSLYVGESRFGVSVGHFLTRQTHLHASCLLVARQQAGLTCCSVDFMPVNVFIYNKTQGHA